MLVVGKRIHQFAIRCERKIEGPTSFRGVLMEQGALSFAQFTMWRQRDLT